MSVSIITSMYNKKKSTIKIIDSLFFPSLLNNASKDKELILIDDCSPLKEETKILIKKYLPKLKKKFKRVVFARNPCNYGFARSFNRGIGLAKGNILIVSNDDIYFPKKSIDSLINSVKKNKNYGIIGPITNEKTACSYQYCKQAPRLRNFSFLEINRIESFAKLVKNLIKKSIIKTDFVAGFCFAVPKKVINEIGVFDEYFKYGFYEDLDFSRRISRKYKQAIIPSVFVYHGGLRGKASLSFRQRPVKMVLANCINFFKFVCKWKAPFWTTFFMLRGLYRMTGRNTVSEDFKKAMKNN
ncbi:glycosyltransferase family 2 protein [Candidatus Woesearchaeota archaeon]|nr:glycosyltransferase family 2 protein [Candidatus Woesearchaeota archaeon]